MYVTTYYILCLKMATGQHSKEQKLIFCDCCYPCSS